jgi:hypothetical protein
MSSLSFDPARHEYALDGVPIPGVSRILDAAGFKTIYPAGDYALRGTRVHAATAFVDQGKAIRVGKGVEPYLDAYRAFLADFPGLRWTVIEEAIYHPRLLYAGTVDRKGQLAYRQVVGDIKTGSPPARRLGLQLAAYAMIVAGRDCLRWGIELKPTGKYKLHICDNEKDFDVYEGLVHRYHWEKKC